MPSIRVPVRQTLLLTTIAVAGAVVLARPAIAQEVCPQGNTQAALTECALAEMRSALRRMDALLAELYPALDPHRAAELRRVQAGWIRVRDEHCRWDAGSYEGGSVQRMWFANCVAHATYERIDALRFHLCGDDAVMAGECAASRRYAPKDSAAPGG